MWSMASASLRSALTTMTGILCLVFAAYKTMDHFRASAAPSTDAPETPPKKAADTTKDNAASADSPAPALAASPAATDDKSDAKVKNGANKKSKKRTAKVE